MIMVWKWNGLDFQATWRGMQFTLLQNETGRWEMYADGKRVRQTWATVREAMNQVDSKQQKIVMRAAADLVESGLKKVVPRA